LWPQREGAAISRSRAGAGAADTGKASGPAKAKAVQSPRTLIQPRRRAAGAPLRPRPARDERDGSAGPSSAAGIAAARTPGGLLLGRYRLLERLGAGGFGVVWRARDDTLQREVAIKRVERADDDDRAYREALATARLAHPAIASLYEARADGGSQYLISELVRGDPLDRLIARGCLEDRTILGVGVALCEALEHAHARGVVHRDVKPANVIVLAQADSGHERVAAKLTDFGSACIAGEDALTRTGDVLGTLAYMAPEQSEGRQATAATDLYALALVLYEALTGINPRRGPTPAATARRLGGGVPRFERHRADLPPALGEALDRALSPLPRERGTIADLRDALLCALGRPAPHRARFPTLRRPALAGDPAAPPFRASQPLSAPRPPAPQTPRPSPAPPPLPATPPATPPAVVVEGSARTRLAVPRVFWWAGALTVIVSQAIAGRPGLALLLCAFAAPLLVLPKRAGPGWLAALLAPLLGMVGLAGAYPALAGQAAALRARVGLAVLGYWWLLLAQPLAGRRLWLWPSRSPLAHPSSWIGSIDHTVTHVIRPVLVLGTLEGAALWALAAAILPWVVRGRSAAIDLVAATVWAAALASAEPLLDNGLPLHGAEPSPRGAILGAVLCGAFAVCARALRGPVSARFRAEGGVT
jgi:serine/threonine protein kinase